MTSTDSLGSPGTVSPREEQLARARRRVEALKGFYIHLTVFVLVMLGLLVTNALTGGPWWVIWVFLGWGVGVAAHALAVMGRTSRRVADWENRKVQQYMADER